MSVLQHFDEFRLQDFIDTVIPQLPPLKFTPRMRVVSTALHKYLPSDYEEGLDILIATLGPELTETTGTFNNGYIYWPISNYIQDYGLEHFDKSMQGIYELTKRFTGEYAIRPFLIQDLSKTLSLMKTWINDRNPHVRRLVSEGTRPTIPWGKKVPKLIDDPFPVFEILTTLNADSEKYVQKSVANHINAISKNHPEYILELVQSWMPTDVKATRWIIKQGLRTLKKVENSVALEILNEL